MGFGMPHVARMRACWQHEVSTIDVDPCFYDTTGMRVDFKIANNMNQTIVASH
jgi:hypothetical protein